MLGFSDASFVCTIVVCTVTTSKGYPRVTAVYCNNSAADVRELAEYAAGMVWCDRLLLCQIGCLKRYVLYFFRCASFYFYLQAQVRYYDWSIGLNECFDWWSVPGWHVVLSTVTALCFRPAFCKGVL